MKTQVYGFVTLYTLRNNYRSFGEACSVHVEVPATFSFLHIYTALTANKLLTNWMDSWIY